MKRYLKLVFRQSISSKKKYADKGKLEGRFGFFPPLLVTSSSEKNLLYRTKKKVNNHWLDLGTLDSLFDRLPRNHEHELFQ